MEITWDLIVLLALTLGTVYGMFIGRNKVLGMVVNLLMAYVFTLAVGDVVYDFVANLGFVSTSLAVSEFATKAFVMAIVFGLLLFKSETAGLDSGGSLTKLQGGFYGLILAGLALSSMFYFMGDIQMVSLDSNFAYIVYNYRSAWVAAPILLMIGTSFMKK